MNVIYDYWPFDEAFFHKFVPCAIVYPPYCFDCNESVWLVPGTDPEDCFYAVER